MSLVDQSTDVNSKKEKPTSNSKKENNTKTAKKFTNSKDEEPTTKKVPLHMQKHKIGSKAAAYAKEHEIKESKSKKVAMSAG